ncbi:hypothetical protein SAMN05661096_01678 [Marivirga sericea]|uniref:Proteinase inhibitor I42 chagasin domain-containing protein n=2 Tax=Marivirga sericea TaxID=1028 RepID=A0A1X7JJ36_9BACT|nr:hypothetical protein SAMN05661096_01678 [Marivirga sericea]
MESDLEAEVIKVNLDGTELYTYSFGDSFPVEGGWEIKKQAENYLISEMNWTEYQYQAKEGFKGIETVEIVLSSSIGDNNFIDQKKWIFEIRVK